MALGCLVWGLQPSEYRSLTRLERQAFSDEAAQMRTGRGTEWLPSQ